MKPHIYQDIQDGLAHALLDRVNQRHDVHAEFEMLVYKIVQRDIVAGLSSAWPVYCLLIW